MTGIIIYMNPFIFMPNCEESKEKYLIKYRHFIWSRLFRNTKSQYLEKHHIVPKSFGMNEDYRSQKWNVIDLSPREHYIAHMLLWKAFGDQMSKAFHFMTVNKRNKFDYRLSSRTYEKLKSDYSKEISKRFTGLIRSQEQIERWKDTYNRKSETEKKKLARNSANACRLNGSLALEKNPKAKKWIILSPYGEKFLLFGNLTQFCDEKMLSMRTLLKNSGNAVIKCPSASAAGQRYYNTIGWTLFRGEA